MNIRDLRVGNFLHHLDEFIIVKGISEDGVVLFNGETNKGNWNDKNTPCEPIPLTEEWLLKFGFTKDDDASWILNDLNFFSILTNSTTPHHLNFKKIGIWASARNGKFYVHQLQNLYFSLFGEELQIK